MSILKKPSPNNNWQMKDPYPGAHIRVKINNLYHHGIYIGNDEVVQFGLPFDMYRPKEEVKVVKTNITEFLQGGFLETRIFTKKEMKQKNNDQKIVEIALSKLGEGGYDIVHNNCEHFANFCIFNNKSSSQIDDIRKEIRNKLNIKN